MFSQFHISGAENQTVSPERKYADKATYSGYHLQLYILSCVFYSCICYVDYTLSTDAC